MQVGPNPLIAYKSKSANYTLTSSDSTVGFDTSGGNVTATLPTAVGCSGRRFTIDKTTSDVNTVTIATTSSQTVGGRASSVIKLFYLNDSLTVESDGANWQIVADEPRITPFVSKTGNYTLTDENETVGFDTSGGNLIATLPTASGRSGRMFTIIKTTFDANYVAIATTSSQTIGGRATQTIALNVGKDRITVVSNGNDWEIVSKRETEVVTATASIACTNTGAQFKSGSPTVQLSPGKWRVRGWFSQAEAGSVNGVLYAASGFYSADGADSASVPASLASGTYVYNVKGNPTCAFAGTYMHYNNTAHQETVPGPEVEVIIHGNNQNVYLVPEVIVATGTASVLASISAWRTE